MNALITKLSQPSTYAGFGGLAADYGLSEIHFNHWVLALVAVFSLIAIGLNEGKTNA